MVEFLLVLSSHEAKWAPLMFRFLFTNYCTRDDQLLGRERSRITHRVQIFQDPGIHTPEKDATCKPIYDGCSGRVLGGFSIRTPACAKPGALPAPDRAGHIRVFETFPNAVLRHQSNSIEFYIPLKNIPSILIASSHIFRWKTQPP